MRKYGSNVEVLRRLLPCRGLSVIDVGCGNGDTVRWLASQGARATGLDGAEMLARARAKPPAGGEEYIAAGAQKLPLADESADIILYQASLHHVPPAEMAPALAECRRVLKKGGRAIFVEPVYRAGAYTELTRLVEDESEAQKRAHAAIIAQAAMGMTMETEELFFLERSFADYGHLVDFFVADAGIRSEIMARARKITEELSAASGVGFDQFRYRSICRLHILRKGRSPAAAKAGAI